ncbi:MAG: hypothetical protein U1F98_10965 [Verrucomicrobiota bacterium]
MKSKLRLERKRAERERRALLRRRLVRAALVAGMAMARAQAADDSAAQATYFEGGTNSYPSWVEFTVGGMAQSGNHAQAQERTQLPGGPFGGISDLHFQEDVAKNTTFTLDGRALFDTHDYKAALSLVKQELGFLKFNFEEFRTYYNGDGGYYSAPPVSVYYPLAADALSVDRGRLTFEGGLTMKDVPEVTFKYTHLFREGEKGSTTWGQTHPLGDSLVRGIAPAFFDLDEKSDTFQLDAKHKVKATDLGLGVSYTTGSVNDSRKVTQYPGEPGAQSSITDSTGSTYNLFDVHASTETWFKKNLMFSSSFLFSDLNSDYSGSRIYGDTYDAPYTPNALWGMGYTGLSGGSHEQQYLLNLNLMSTVFNNFTVVPSVRVQKKVWNANDNGLGTLGTATQPFEATSDADTLDVRECVDLRYTGVTNWVFFGGVEWTEGNGNLNENGGLSQVNGIGVPPIARTTDEDRFFQRYSLGARWYPVRWASLDGGGFYKNDNYNYDNTLDSTPNDSGSNATGGGDRYPAYFTSQAFQTWDGNVRLTLRPVRNVILVSRYDFQRTAIQTQPDSISGLNEQQSGLTRNQILSQSISWTPWTRLSTQVGFNYVWNSVTTPAAAYTDAIQNARNNYWTVTFNSTVVLDDRTDLNLGYFYYQANNFQNYYATGLPLGAGAQEQGVTAGLVRRIRSNIRAGLKYGYFSNVDETYGGNRDYHAQVVSTSVQYLF